MESAARLPHSQYRQEMAIDEGYYSYPSFLHTELKRRFGSAPLIAQTVLTLSNRQFDVASIAAINAGLLKQRSNALPVYLSFDLLDLTLLSPDGLHPSSAGWPVPYNLAQSKVGSPVIESNRENGCRPASRRVFI